MNDAEKVIVLADALREVLNAYSMDDDAMDSAIGVAREALAKAGL